VFPQFAVKPVEGFFVYEGGLRVEDCELVERAPAVYGAGDEQKPQWRQVQYFLPRQP